MPENNVLVCVTGRLTCEQLIIKGAEIAGERDGKLSVLHVVKPGNSLLGNKNEGEALEYLYRVACAHNGDMLMVRSDDIAGAIAEQAKKSGAGVIVMGYPGNKEGVSLNHAISARAPGLEIIYP